jgi:membrane-associated phospholipid phosphatase
MNMKPEPPDISKPVLLHCFCCAVALSTMFLLVYGGCLAITAFRHDVHTLYFPWELQIPLVPAMIVPYWTLDLFFVGSFFFCDTRRELNRLSLRLAAALLVAGAGFLMFPLKTVYPNPHVGGFFGAWFDLLHGFDLPYNCAPSLHIAIAVILWAAYVPKLRYGPMRLLVALWFGLIMASTLLTWQHHVIDVVSGAVLGIGCLWIGLPRRGPSAVPPRIFLTRTRNDPGRRCALPRRGRGAWIIAAPVRASVLRRRVPRRRARAIRSNRH